MHPAAAYAATASDYICATFRALAEALIPDGTASSVYGDVEAAGAVALCVHEYMIWELDHSLSLMQGLYLSVVPLSGPTVGLLNCGAVQFVASGQNRSGIDYSFWPVSPFASLHPVDRIRVLAMLEQTDLDLGVLPPPYQRDGGLVRFIIDFLNRQILFGNYSEWSAYGSTRLQTPVRRRLEGFPAGWIQAEYPGVAPGYRALCGNVLTIVRQEGGSSIVCS
ncbi:hypothetical protein [Paenibacillus sp. MMS20-IR301]|uniref:hypothetical protein n=1 Tax=Paenibacillus sp. MMS20-IR301 TaxID=2895946 RepID=UPI0028F05CA1|nr:hypothetical protein [Paenibacillus sp. MMS20-IR301]WNS44072.1 hypothetical protein LOS79_02050 [Paenibacillus sp. MMS20-IR301]